MRTICTVLLLRVSNTNIYFFFVSLFNNFIKCNPDFDLVDDDTSRAVLRMFMQCNLVSQFHIPYEVS